MEKTGLIILAAGNSSRLGRPKQLLEHRGTSLLKRTIKEALLINSLVVVVTGAYEALIREEIKAEKVFICHNDNWQQGMGSSIKTGVSQLLLLSPEVSGCILCVCDQPYVSSDIFKQLIAAAQSGTSIAASAYSATLGTPVFFSRVYFDELLELNGHQGAKALLEKYREKVSTVPFHNGAIDIDSESDYKKLNERNDFSS